MHVVCVYSWHIVGMMHLADKHRMTTYIIHVTDCKDRRLNSCHDGIQIEKYRKVES